MRAGELDRRVTIEVNTPTQDGTGGAIDSWAPLATVWAKRRDAQGREFFDAAQVTGAAVTVYTIRWRGDVTAAMRIIDGAETWDIKSPAAVGGRKEALALFCERLGA